MKLPNTLASRLTFWYAVIFVLFSTTAFLLFYFSVDSILDDQLQEDLFEDIEEFRLLYQSEGKVRLLVELEREVLMEDQATVFFRLLDSNGKRIFSSNLDAWDETEIEKLPRQSDAIIFAEVSMADEGESAVTASGPLGGGIQMLVGEALEDKNDFMEVLVKLFAGIFPLLISLGAFAGWIMAKQALRGVEAVSRAAIDVANGKLDRRVVVSAKGEEIQRLVQTFNTMVDRLRSLISGMRGMTDNIAHDLRSPLGRIRAGAEQALSSAVTLEDHKKSAVNTLEECDRLLHMINTTLDVAETEAGAVDLDKQETDISQIVLDACELYEPVAEDKGIRITHKIELGCRVLGNISYLQRMLGNLLENSLKYTRKQGEIDIKLERQGREVLIKVADTGVGIEADDQLRVFDRFFRCDASRTEPGCGLGLSLARAIARAHGGDISLSSDTNTGTVFTIALPG